MAIGFSLITGMLLAERAADPAVISIPQPIVIPAATPAPAPAPVPEPVVEEAPPALRLAAPMLMAECFGREDVSAIPACEWDTGFPAISGDGKRVAYLQSAGRMGGTDVVIFDATTDKLLRRIVISRFDDLRPDDEDDPAVRAKIIQRTQAAQQILVDGKYRSLLPLGTHAPTNESVDKTGDVRTVHAEWTGATLQVIDPSSHTVLFRHTFSAPSPKRDPLSTEMCGGWTLAQIGGWWDPEARVVIGDLLYHEGGCMCDSTSVRQTFRF